MAKTFRQALESHSVSTDHGTTENHFGLIEERKHLERRDKIDIILTMLEITTQPIKKTHILYTAKINFYQLTKYLQLILALGLVEEISDPFEGYRITEKGRVLLTLFART